MALGGEQARCGIEANPTGAWQVDLCPGVKIRAHRLSKSLSLPGARLLLSRLGAGLDQITGDKPSRKPELAQRLNQQPAAIAARPRSHRQGLRRSLHSDCFTYCISNVRVNSLVDLD